MPSIISSPSLSRRAAISLGSGSFAAALALGGYRSAAALDVATPEANKALARRVFDEAIDRGQAVAMTELFASDYVDRGASARQMPGPAGMPLTVDEFQALAPGVHPTVDAAVAEGDLVALHVTWRGEHPPSGTHVVGRTMHLFRVGNGQIIEGWSVGWEWLERLSNSSSREPGNPLIGA